MAKPSGWCPIAMKRPIPEATTQPGITPTQGIVHTAVDGAGTTTLFPWWTTDGNNLEAHGYLQGTGGIEQYLPATVRADANCKANPRAVSLETHDGWYSTGQSGQVTTPWNQAQLNAIILWCAWLRDDFGIPPVLCPEWDAPGFGWHKMHREWSCPTATGCPGDVRAAQFRDIVIPALNYTPGPIPTVPPKPKVKDMPSIKLDDSYYELRDDGVLVAQWPVNGVLTNWTPFIRQDLGGVGFTLASLGGVKSDTGLHVLWGRSSVYNQLVGTWQKSIGGEWVPWFSVREMQKFLWDQGHK